MVDITKLKRKFNGVNGESNKPLTEEQLRDIVTYATNFRKTFDVTDENGIVAPVSDERTLYFINSGVCKDNPLSMKRFSHIMKED